MAGKRKRRGEIEGRAERRKRRLRQEDRETIRRLRERVTRAQHQLDELLAKKEEEMKENAAEKGKGAEDEEEELEDGYTLDNDPSGAQCSRPRKSSGRNHEKWQRYKEIFSLYYAETGDLKMPQSYEHHGVKIGRILANIRWKGDWVKDNPQRKQWLLERGVILTYDSGLCLSDTTSVEKWQRYKEIFSLYYSENGDLNMPVSYEHHGIKIGIILRNIRVQGCFVRDNAPRKLWLLEKGVSFTYDSLNSASEEKWRRYKEIFSLYYAENGDLMMPISYEHQGVKIGRVLSEIRLIGNFVKDNPQRKQWLLEKGVSFTYDSLNSPSEEKWQRYKEMFSLYYAENGDLKMPQSYVCEGVKIGSVLSTIRYQGCFVRDNPQRKLWLLEKGVSFTYDS